MTAPNSSGVNALALLTASYDGLMGEVINGVLNEGAGSTWFSPDPSLVPSLQGIQDNIADLTAKIERLTALLADMTYLARALTANLAKANGAEEADILDALGRAIHERSDE
ncbi:hypothetical protein [Mycolicibacterium sp. D5.8-2]|uniref:hypothetical protein n=1 Tax=Mycolicibacterium sp. D5.8-2 TaxID=3085903 RepID=UPI00298D4960|nr:hypothetical protein [Mycolicibacterium sp. D5.8-2]MDW5612500.1 hypothetical protein [Mycolicibacterium sp. D5.8-2]